MKIEIEAHYEQYEDWTSKTISFSEAHNGNLKMRFDGEEYIVGLRDFEALVRAFSTQVKEDNL